MRRGLLLAVAVGVLAIPTTAGAQSLDYGYFKANIQPIFLTKREGYTRCIVCHAGANNAMRLTPLAPGATTFTEEQSKTNFETLVLLHTTINTGGVKPLARASVFFSHRL